MDPTMQVYLALPEAPDLAGLRFRRLQLEADVAALEAVFVACQERDRIDPRSTHDAITSPEELAVALTAGPRFDPARDALVAEVAEGPVGLAMVMWWTGHGTWIYTLVGFVHPAWRGRGIGRALLRWSEQRARELAGVQVRPGETATYAVNTSDTAAETVRLLEREGYALSERMAAMALEPITPREEPKLPAGIEVRPMTAEGLPAIWAAYTDVYAERWVDRAPTEGEYQGFDARFLGNPDFAPELTRVAWAGERVVAYTMVKRGRGRGAFDTVGTRPAWRRRGLAGALIIRALNAMAAEGIAHAALHTDAEDGMGARTLYERLGFRVVKEHWRYRKALVG